MIKKILSALLIGILGLSSLSLAQNDPIIPITYDVFLFGFGAFSLVVMTDDGVVVVDPINSQQAGLLDSAIKSMTDQPVRFVLYSHNHWDHISGGQVFKIREP